MDLAIRDVSKSSSDRVQALPRRASPGANGYLAAVTPALERALASAHEEGHERAVRILHAVLAILDDPDFR